MRDVRRRSWRRGMVLVAMAAAVVSPVAVAQDRARASGSPAFAQFVDDYLDRFAYHHPSIAAGNGLHGHDDRIEDFTAAAVRAEIGELKASRTRLAAIPDRELTRDELMDKRIIFGLIDGWLLDLETIGNWRRNPMIYASAITDGVHNLMTMDSDPIEIRVRRVIAKLRGVPGFLAGARTSITAPPRVFVEHAIGMFRGASGMLETDLPQAFASLADAQSKADLAAAAATARAAIDEYTTHLEKTVLPAANAPFAIGRANLAARYRAEELIDQPVETLLAIGRRELARHQRQFRATARRVDASRDPLAVWQDVLRNHPARGELVAATQRTVDELTAFVRAKRLVDLPSEERVVVAPSPPFDLGLASMHSAPPLETRPVKSFYYVTDASPDWPAARQDAWLQKFNYATLSDITAHEVMPGHFVHSLFMRRTPGKIRRIWIGLNPFPQPSSGQDGWAHYAEQLVIDQGFKHDQPQYELAQISEALTRICRLIAGIELHSGGWTIDQAARFFQENAHLPGPAARQEAERGTYDPTYGGYFLGKRAALKLRRDYQASLGARFDLRAFHERIMTNGIAPWWVHRQLLLPGDTGAVVQ
jgi:uncharacterized protein (DUF885 family)